jgi:4-hydroxybenzoate polyprenyltransferase
VVSVQKTGIVYEIQVYERLLKDLNLLDILIYGSIYLSLGAAATMYASCLLLGLPPSPELMFIAFSSTFAIYNFNRLTDKKEDVINHPERYKFNMSYGHIFMAIALIIYSISIILTVQKGIIALLILFFPLIMGGLYSIKIPSLHRKIHRKEKYARLKDIPLVKNLTATTAWTASITLLPAFYLSANVGFSILFVFLLIFGRFLISTITFDIRDIEGDKLHGIHTIPAILGVKKTQELLILINMVIFALITIATYVGILPVLTYLIITLSTLFTDLYLVLIPSSFEPVILYDVIIDGEFIAFGFFALLGKMIA